MIPRLGDGNIKEKKIMDKVFEKSLENDSPSRGRKQIYFSYQFTSLSSLENDSPSRGRKRGYESKRITTMW